MLLSEAGTQLVKLLVTRENIGTYRTTEWLSYLKDKPTSYLTMINFKDNFSSIDLLVEAIKSVYFAINGEGYDNLKITFIVGDNEAITAVYLLFTEVLTEEEVATIENTLKVKLESKDTNVAMLVA